MLLVSFAVVLIVRLLASTVPPLLTFKTLPVAPPVPTVMPAVPALASHTPPLATVTVLLDEALPMMAGPALTREPLLFTSKVARPLDVPEIPMFSAFVVTQVEPAPVTCAMLEPPLRLTAPVLVTTPPLITTNVPKLVNAVLMVHTAPALLTMPPAWLISGIPNVLEPLVPMTIPPLAFVNAATSKLPPLRRIVPVLTSGIRLPLRS